MRYDCCPNVADIPFMGYIGNKIYKWYNGTLVRWYITA